MTIKAITVPKWGLAMEEGEFLSWLVAPGDEIRLGQEIAEIETTKIAGTVEAAASGTVRRLVAKEQQVLPVGALLAVLTDENESDEDIEDFIEKFQVPGCDDLGKMTNAGPRTERLSLGDLDIFYFEYVPEQADLRKPPILFIHGFGGDSGNWLFNTEKFGAAQRVIALDLPGHGQSSKRFADGSITGLARTLQLFLDNLGLSRVQVVGHSLGAAVALRLALLNPERVAGLVLICPVLVGKAVNREYISAFINARTRKQMKPILQALFSDAELVTGELIENILRYKRLDGVDAALQCIAEASLLQDDFPFSADEIAQLNMPITLVWGVSDKILSDGATRLVIKKPGAEYRVENSGHMPHMENSAMVNGIIERHLLLS